MGRSLLQVHIAQKNIPGARLRKCRRQTGRCGGDSGAPRTTGHRNQLRLMGHVVDLKIGDEPIPQRFVIRPQSAPRLPRRDLPAACFARSPGLLRARRRSALLIRPAPLRWQVNLPPRDRQKKRQTQFRPDLFRTPHRVVENQLDNEPQRDAAKGSEDQGHGRQLKRLFVLSERRRRLLHHADVGKSSRSKVLHHSRLFPTDLVIMIVRIQQNPLPFQLSYFGLGSVHLGGFGAHFIQLLI